MVCTLVQSTDVVRHYCGSCTSSFLTAIHMHEITPKPWFGDFLWVFTSTRLANNFIMPIRGLYQAYEAIELVCWRCTRRAVNSSPAWSSIIGPRGSLFAIRPTVCPKVWELSGNCSRRLLCQGQTSQARVHSTMLQIVIALSSSSKPRTRSLALATTSVLCF